jgi:hypothetical protein
VKGSRPLDRDRLWAIDMKHWEIKSQRFEGENHPRVPSRKVLNLRRRNVDRYITR